MNFIIGLFIFKSNHFSLSNSCWIQSLKCYSRMRVRIAASSASTLFISYVKIASTSSKFVAGGYTIPFLVEKFEG